MITWTKDEFKKLQHNDSLTLKKFYDGYKEKVFRFLLMKTKGDEELSNDLLSETFFSAIKSLKKMKHGNNIQSWLLQIANRRFNDHLRKLYKDKKLQQELDKIDPYYEEDHVSNIHKKEMAAILQLVFQEMKPEYHQVIRMKYLEGMTHKQIAEETGIHKKNVESIHYRALKELEKQFQLVMNSNYKPLLDGTLTLRQLNTNTALFYLILTAFYFIKMMQTGHNFWE